jgi:tetratricopeptide (TPR) repeat protein
MGPVPRRAGAGILFSLAAFSGAAAAQSPAAPPASSSAASSDADERKARALEVFQRSLALYKDGDYRRSIELLETAYAVYPEPVLLFNLGRAYEKLGETSKAVDEYERYLGADPAAPDRADIEQRIEVLRQGLHAPAPPPSSGTRAPIQATVATTPGDARPSPSASPYPWILAGAGVAVMGSGIVLGTVAVSRHNQAVSEHDAGRAASLQDAATRFALWTNVTFIGGGALAAAGVVLGVVSVVSAPKKWGARSGVQLRVGVGLGSASVGGSF